MVDQERKKMTQLSMHSIGHIFCFGNVLVSPFSLRFCGENNVNLAVFRAISGWQSGNILLLSVAVSGIGAKSRADYAQHHYGKNSDNLRFVCKIVT